MKRLLYILVCLIYSCSFCCLQAEETRLNVYVSSIDSIHTYLGGGKQIFVAFVDSVPDWTQKVNRTDISFFSLSEPSRNAPKTIRKRSLVGKSTGVLGMKIVEDEQSIKITLYVMYYRRKWGKSYCGLTDSCYTLNYYNEGGIWKLFSPVL